MKNEFQRFIKLIGSDCFTKIENTSVLIVGVGGVGSYAVETLARSGIQNIILLDYDSVDITNINRQILALNSTIGSKKIDVLKNRILDINKNANVITIDLFLNNDNINILNNYKIDYIIDACDTVNTKIELIKYAQNNKIKIISSMGTGNKFDPSKLEITTIDKTSYDPLAKVIRKKLKEEKINHKLVVVSSKESPIKLDDNIIGSTAFVPSTAGILCASYVVNDIIKKTER